jgi:hypothetical protein
MFTSLRPPPDDDEGPDRDDEDTEILDDVELKSFIADPITIVPFGYSTLRWRVEGPNTPRWVVILSGSRVNRIGSTHVNPLYTYTYYLTARAGRVQKALGHVQVVVNTQSCELFQTYPRREIYGLLEDGVNNSSEAYFRSYLDENKRPQTIKPVVTFTTGKISYSLRLFGRSGKVYIPDPHVDIDASFGLIISESREELIATNMIAHVDVSFPWYVWTLPPPIPSELNRIVSEREPGIRDRILNEDIPNLVRYINLEVVPSEGKRLSRVTISEGPDNIGVIDIMACPNEILNQLARVTKEITPARNNHK